jgi:hypothetical protein
VLTSARDRPKHRGRDAARPPAVEKVTNQLRAADTYVQGRLSLIEG